MLFQVSSRQHVVLLSLLAMLNCRADMLGLVDKYNILVDTPCVATGIGDDFHVCKE